MTEMIDRMGPRYVQKFPKAGSRHSIMLHFKFFLWNDKLRKKKTQNFCCCPFFFNNFWQQLASIISWVLPCNSCLKIWKIFFMKKIKSKKSKVFLKIKTCNYIGSILLIMSPKCTLFGIRPPEDESIKGTRVYT